MDSACRLQNIGTCIMYNVNVFCVRVCVYVYEMNMRWHVPSEYLNKYANNQPQIKTYITSIA